ncbi:MAG: hypothetical protein HY961_00335 [Ignavibacteriae bacterium]|nr:hypothetical protein [Ignavibacteriota bacterium]
MNNMFSFVAADYATQFAEHGFVHVRGGLTKEFYDLLAKQVDREANRLKDWAIGNKQQSLYEFPETADYYRQLMSTIGSVCGLDPETLALSERHIKVYESDANPNPQAHKDRYASEISVGFSVTVPAGSRLVMYPYDELWVNPYNTWARLRASLSEDQMPEKRLVDAKKIVIEDKPGDVMIFRGNSIWHLRENPANTTNLYLKLNSFNCDPLGEDPYTTQVRTQTLALLRSPDEILKRLIPLVGRRVDYFNQQLSRDWQPAHEVVFWGERALKLNPYEMNALKVLEWNKTVGNVLSIVNGTSESTGLATIRRLASEGVIDLFESRD